MNISIASQTWLIRRTTRNDSKYLLLGLTPSHLNQNLLGKSLGINIFMKSPRLTLILDKVGNTFLRSNSEF